MLMPLSRLFLFERANWEWTPPSSRLRLIATVLCRLRWKKSAVERQYSSVWQRAWKRPAKLFNIFRKLCLSPRQRHILQVAESLSKLGRSISWPEQSLCVIPTAPFPVPLGPSIVSTGTFPGTVSMCTAVAAQVEGTVVREATQQRDALDIRIGHPAGVMQVGATVSHRGGEWSAERVTTTRTARRIMEGSILVPQQYLDGKAWFEDKG